jgi:hypothetical protein
MYFKMIYPRPVRGADFKGKTNIMAKLVRFVTTAATAAVAAVILASPITVSAKTVGPQEAEGLVRRFAESGHNVRLKHTVKKQLHGLAGGGGLAKPSASPDGREAALFYVFNVTQGADSGFVIVAGDDALRPVLGYSDNGGFDENNLPPNFAYWIDCLRRQAEYALEHGAAQSEAVRQEWNDYISGGVHNMSMAKSAATAAVSPLIQTTWNQRAPYNDMCPTPNYPNTSGTRMPTGCVATAMAQIMKFHRYSGPGYVYSTAYTTGSLKFNMPAEILGGYEWNNMLNSYATAASGTVTQRNAVATLMYHAGLSVEMDYKADGSGAYSIDVPKALTEYFGYDESIQRKDRDAYNNASWENMLKEQLDTGLPVYYSGVDTATASGHAFLCDGYDASGKFHFNWGWGGTYNGYFVTAALEPGTGGTGAGAGKYNDNQYILINIKPNNGGPASTCELALRNKFTVSNSTVTPIETFVVEFGVVNTGWRALPSTVSIGAALVDNNSRVVEVVGRTTMLVDRDNNILAYQSRIPSCRVSDNVPSGTYTLKMVFSIDGGVNWIPINLSYANVPNSINFTVNHVPPIIIAHPTNQAIASGSAASFSVTAASNSTGTLTYQWQVNTSASVAPVPRNITVSMWDQTGDGWNGGSLRISVNGNDLSTNPTINMGNTGTYKFNIYPGDIVAFYWNISNYNSECAFAAFYTDAPPSPAFNPTTAAANDTAALLVYRQYGGLISSAGKLLGSFKAAAATDIDFFSNVSNGTGATTATYTTPATTAAMSGYRYRCVVSNNHALSDTSEYAIMTIKQNAIMSPDRIVPIPSDNDKSAVSAPPPALTAEFTAGPNPVARQDGAVNFFRQGVRVSDSELLVYKATGNVVAKIKINDSVSGGSSVPGQNIYARRLVGSWDLMDSKGRLVPAGTYMIRGTAVTAHGKKEKVSVLVGIR